MGETEAKLGGFACLALLIGYAIYTNAETVKLYLGWAIFIAAVLIALLFFLLLFPPWYREQRDYANAPETGPMKINIRTERIRKGCRLHIDVTMSQKDRDALKWSGIEGNELFDYPHPSHSDVQISYANRSLLTVKSVDFPDMTDAEIAKFKLLEGLHALRTRLDQSTAHKQEQQRGDPFGESFEI